MVDLPDKLYALAGNAFGRQCRCGIEEFFPDMQCYRCQVLEAAAALREKDKQFTLQMEHFEDVVAELGEARRDAERDRALIREAQRVAWGPHGIVEDALEPIRTLFPDPDTARVSEVGEETE